MRRFAELYAELDASTATSAKVEAMATYFAQVPAADAAWAVHVLTGRKLKRLIRSGELRTLAARASGYPEWLVEESYSHVGDLAETIDLLLDAPLEARDELSLSTWIEQRLAPLPSLDEAGRAVRLLAWWSELPHAQRFVLNKLMTGSLRVGVSQRLVVQALARVAGLDTALVAHRLTGDWTPTPAAFRALLDPAGQLAVDVDQPYPFFLASPLEHAVETLGERADWLAEWKWDGIRAQLLKRDGAARLWSRGEERLDGRFPEIEAAAAALPDGVAIDGEILAWRDGAPLPFTALQKRIGRLKPGAKSLADAPVVLLAYDLVEDAGIDIRTSSLQERRARLAQHLATLPAGADAAIQLSPALDGDDWQALARLREASRERGVEGLMLKRLASPYQVGRKRGDWWKWKVEPYTLDAVLIYAQAGHGRRANLFTDYTFAVWDGDALVPVAKAYSGLTDEEIGRLDRWIRAHTLERFGPVRSVEPHHVFELAFEAINASSRHKSGVAVRFPRILRWRTDLSIRDADSLDQLKTLAGG